MSLEKQTDGWPEKIVLFRPLGVIERAIGWICTHQPDPHPFDSELYDQAEHGED